MQITKEAKLRQKNISQAFTVLREPEDMLRIFTKDGNLSFINRNLLRFTSSLVNSIFSGVPCCSSTVLFIPEVSKVAVDHVLSILKSGYSDFNSVSIKQIQEVQEAAKMLRIDLSDLDYVKKSLLIDPKFNKVNEIVDTNPGDAVDEMTVVSPILYETVSIKSEEPEIIDNETLSLNEDEESSSNISIKTEYSEALHGNDSTSIADVANSSVVELKEETELDINVNEEEITINMNCEISENTLELTEEESTHIETNTTQTDENTNTYPGLALTPPPEQSIYSPFKIPLKKRKYSQEAVVQDLAAETQILASTPPPELQNKESLISELPFFASDIPSPKIKLLENEQMDQESGIDIVPFLHRPPKCKSKPIYFDDQSNLTQCTPIDTSRRSSKTDKHSPIDALAHQAAPGPPRSVKPELQYIYRPFYHDKCGARHSRVDDCAAAVPHKVCGQQHSYFKRCDGSWMRLHKLEEVALRWPTQKEKRRMHGDDALENNDEDMTAVGVFSQQEHDSYYGPPISDKADLQYVYESFHHVKCGKTHRRVDLCDAAPPHNVCGRTHSYAMDCTGLWMTVDKFEMLAMKWPTTRMRIKKSSDDYNPKDAPRRKRIRYENTHGSSSNSSSNSISNMQKPYKEMSEDEKKENTCEEWNFGQCVSCKFGNRKRHRCSRMVGDHDGSERICWGDHREAEHEPEDRDAEEQKRKRTAGTPEWDLRRVIVKTKPL